MIQAFCPQGIYSERGKMGVTKFTREIKPKTMLGFREISTKPLYYAGVRGFADGER